MGAGASVEDKTAAWGEMWTKAAAILADEKTSGNRCAKYLCDESVKAWAEGLEEEQKMQFYACVKTGIENPSSGLGCYAMTPADYTQFATFFDKVIGDYHKGDPAAADVHVTDWDASAVGEGGVLDVTKLGLEEVSMRVRVGRNLSAFNLPGLMDQDERTKFENTIIPSLEKLVANEAYGGNIYSMSPDLGKDADGNAIENKYKIDDAKYQELVDAHVMFKDMDADTYLKSAGISSDWPYGRGCWQSEDKQCIIWFGEEDQFRIMCMKKGTKIDEVFNRLKTMLDVVEQALPEEDGKKMTFATSERFGYVTSCPSNLGTGMRASVHVKIPNLTADGTDAKAKAVAKPLGLSVRGTGGEHTPIGADGTVDISPSARLFIKEAEIIAALYNGIEALMKEENAAGEAAAAAAPAAEAAAETAAAEAPAAEAAAAEAPAAAEGEAEKAE